MRHAVFTAVIIVAGVIPGGFAGAEGIRDYMHEADYDDKWPGRMGHAVVTFEDRLYVMGGLTTEGFLNDVYYADHEEKQWIRLKDAAWSPRTVINGVAKNGKVWIMGGFDGGRTGEIWSSSDMENWELSVEKTPWPERLYESIGELNGKVYVIGGERMDEPYNDVWASEDMVNWELVTEHAQWNPRTRTAVTTYDGKLWLTGGAYWGTDKYVYHNDVWNSTDGKDWTLVSDGNEWLPRCQHQLVTNEDLMWLIGGDDDPMTTSAARDIWVSRDGIKWIEATPTARFQKTGYITATVHQGQIWILGGMKYSAGIWNYKKECYWLERGSLESAGIEVP